MPNEGYLMPEEKSHRGDNAGSSISHGTSTRIEGTEDQQLWQEANKGASPVSVPKLFLARADEPKEQEIKQDEQPKDQDPVQTRLSPRERHIIEEDIRNSYVSGDQFRQTAKDQTQNLIRREIASGDLRWAQNHLTEALTRFPEWAKSADFKFMVKRSGAWFDKDFSDTFKNLPDSEELYRDYANLNKLSETEGIQAEKRAEDIRQASRNGDLKGLEEFAELHSNACSINPFDHTNRRLGALALDCLANKYLEMGNKEKSIETLQALFQKFPEATNNETALVVAGKAGYMYDVQRLRSFLQVGGDFQKLDADTARMEKQQPSR